jgi:hypothetical protein
MSEVVTSLTIDATGATQGAQQFVDKMDSCQTAAEKTVGSMAGLVGGISDTNSALVALASLMGAGAVAAGLVGFIDYVVSANKSLADMQTMAKQVGLTLADFQGIQFGGQIAGLSTAQINTGLEKSASLLNDASRNANSLSKELDANGLSVKNANGQLISQNDLLKIAANLISNAANPGDAQAIAQMLGFTKEWIPLLEQGGAAMGDLTEQAKAAGAVIDDSIIQKAQEFDTAWRTSSVTWSSYMKAALADLLPYLDDLIVKTAEWIKTLPKQAQAASTATFQQMDEAGIPDSVGVIKIDADQLQQATKDFQNSSVFSIDTWINLGKGLGAGFQSMTPQQANQNIPGYAASQIVEPSYPSADAMDAAFKKAGTSIDATAQKAKDWAQDAAQDAADGFSKVAARALSA